MFSLSAVFSGIKATDDNWFLLHQFPPLFICFKSFLTSPTKLTLNLNIKNHMWAFTWPHLSIKHETPLYTCIHTSIWVKRTIHGGQTIHGLWTSLSQYCHRFGYVACVHVAVVCSGLRCLMRGLTCGGELWSEHGGQLSPRGEERWKRGKTSAGLVGGGEVGVSRRLSRSVWFWTVTTHCYWWSLNEKYSCRKKTCSL